jgi:hypothetical protein
MVICENYWSGSSIPQQSAEPAEKQCTRRQRPASSAPGVEAMPACRCQSQRPNQQSSTPRTALSAGSHTTEREELTVRKRAISPSKRGYSSPEGGSVPHERTNRIAQRASPLWRLEGNGPPCDPRCWLAIAGAGPQFIGRYRRLARTWTRRDVRRCRGGDRVIITMRACARISSPQRSTPERRPSSEAGAALRTQAAPSY